MDRVAYAIATGAGAGLSPVAPGTIGAVEGVGLYLAAIYLVSSPLALGPAAVLAVLVVLNLSLFAVGVWSATRTCSICGLKDPGKVVIDEVSGQFIALTPLVIAPSIARVALAFVLFRLFDIFKPYPIYKLEQLHAGLGVMSDDALAGVYAAAVVWLALHFRLI